MTDVNDLFGSLFDDEVSAVDVEDEPKSNGTLPRADKASEDDRPAAAAVEPKSVPAGYLFFDLECVPDYSRESLFDLPAIAEAGPRTPAKDMLAVDQLRTASLEEIKQVVRSKRPDEEYLASLEATEKADKKPRKGLFDLIEEIRGESATIQAAKDERRKKMAVSPEMCRIVSMATARGNDPVEAVCVDPKDKKWWIAEAKILQKFWQLAGQAKVIGGFNSNGYDLPVIFMRSLILGVAPTRKIDLTPWKGETCDLMALRWPRGGAMGLKVWATLMGVPIPAGDVDGSMVEAMWLAGELEKLKEYNRSDVTLVREIYRRGRGMWWV